MGLPKHPSIPSLVTGMGCCLAGLGSAGLLLRRVRTLLLEVVGGRKLSLVILQMPSNRVRRTPLTCPSFRDGHLVAHKDSS